MQYPSDHSPASNRHAAPGSLSHAENVFAQHKARKRFGQNFLHDANIIQRIVAAIAPKAGQHLLEIGPGQGAITAELLRHPIALTAVELDRDLAGALREHFASFPQFSLVEGNALEFDLHSLGLPPHSLRVVGNLPYNISTPILFHLLAQLDCIADMHFMLQKEVVQRMAAGPGDSDYGRLSVMLQYHCRVAALFDVPPGAFNPPPKVTSAIVRLQPHPASESDKRPKADDEMLLARIVTQAFQQRRKTLRNTLKGLVSETRMTAVGIDPGCRAETLSVADFVRLSNSVE